MSSLSAASSRKSDNADIARRLWSHDVEILHELIETYQHRVADGDRWNG